VTDRTVQNHLRGMNYVSSSPRAVPLLTSRQIHNRVDWCTSHLPFDWRKVVFTDETYIECGGPRAKIWDKNDHLPIRPKAKFPTKSMFWSAISVEKRMGLIVIPGRSTKCNRFNTRYHDVKGIYRNAQKPFCPKSENNVRRGPYLCTGQCAVP
jgi:hypothetical protein